MFPEEEFNPMEADDGQSNLDSSKVYKIKYSINLLPLVGAHISID